MKTNNLSLQIRLERDDNLPAFGAFLRCEPPDPNQNHVILLNVQAVMWPESSSGARMSRDERKRVLITTLMHEFGHALEAHMSLPVCEESIEAACADWERLHAMSSDL